MSKDDTIGVVHEHRWCKSAEQVKRLEADGCRIIVSLGGGKAKQVTFDELLKFARPGTVFKFVHVMFLADLRKRGAKAVRASFALREKKLVDGKHSVLKDLDSQLTTEQPGHRKAIMVLTDDLIKRHAQGEKTAAINVKRRGRLLAKFEDGSEAEYYAAWRNLADYPRWEDLDAAFAAIDEKYGHEQPFTRYRASRKWPGGRRAKTR